MKVDTHQHFWNLAQVEYSWLVPEYGPIYATFEPKDLAPQVKAAGIDKTVLVQSANNYADTASMLVHADYNDWIGAVIGWVDLLDPAKTGFARSRQNRSRFKHLHEASQVPWYASSHPHRT